MKNTIKAFALAWALAGGPFGAASETDAARTSLLQQSLIDKVWLYEQVMARTAPEKSDAIVLKSYCGFLFQLFEIQELQNDKSDVWGPVMKAVAASDLTQKVEPYSNKRDNP